MRKILRIFIVIFLTMPTVNSGVALAQPAYQPSFDQTYPGSSLTGDCVVCHSGQWSLSSYGSDWKDWGKDYMAIENLDSDNDGFTNIDEIVAGTYPGDRFSMPAPTNHAPTANAGPDRTVSVNSTVLLDGSGSTDSDQDTLTYNWTLTSIPTGSRATLSDAAAARPTFYVDLSGTYEVALVVNDGTVDSIPDIVTIFAQNSAPSANAGDDQNVGMGDIVTLDGSNSTDPDDGIAAYLWTQTGGTEVILSNPSTATPTFTAPNVGSSGESLTFQLTVTDTGGLDSIDSCIVNVIVGNQPPTADAGPDQTVVEGITVTLDGSDSTDPDDGIAAYLWTQTGGTTVILSDPAALRPTFTAPDVGEGGESLAFVLTVGDNGGLQDTATVIVNVTWVNQSPTADAGVNLSVIESATVTLNGTNSTDPDDGIAAYLWTQTSGPLVTLSDYTAMQPTFVSPPVDITGTILAFNLTVEDNGGLQAGDTVYVTVMDNGITGFPENVHTMITASGDPIGIIENNGGVFISLNTIDPSSITVSPDMPEDFSIGLIDMHIKVASPGATTSVTVYLPTPAPEGYKWYKYNSSDGWIDYSANAVFNATRDEISLTLTDGGLGDDDKDANGVIADPSGLGISFTTPSSNSVTTTAGDWGSISGCFIATAAYGSLMEPHVKLLQAFRDRVLLKYRTGKAFVRFYYTYSPPLADFIATHDTLRAVVRWSLMPLVGFSWVAVRFGTSAMLFTAVSLLLMISFTVVVFSLQIKKRKLRIERYLQ